MKWTAVLKVSVLLLCRGTAQTQTQNVEKGDVLLTIPPKAEWSYMVKWIESLPQPYGGYEAYTEENSALYFGDEGEAMAFRHVPELTQLRARDIRYSSTHEMDWWRHYLQTIYVLDENRNVVFLAVTNVTLPDHVQTTFQVSGEMPLLLTPYSHCNLHGLWRGKAYKTADASTWNNTKAALEKLAPEDSLSCPAQTASLFVIDDSIAISLRLVDSNGGTVGDGSTTEPVALEVQGEFPKNFFFALGFAGQMVPADMLVCANIGEEVGCWDYYSDNRVHGPRPDSELGGTNEVKLLEFAINASDALPSSFGQTVKIAVRKSLKSGDKFDTVLKTGSDEKQDMIFAFFGVASGSSFAKQDFLRYHGLDSRGYLSANLRSLNAVSSCATSTERDIRDLQIMHGVMMYLLWAVIITTGALLARYWKGSTWWLGAHRALQGIGTIITIPGFMLTYSWTASNQRAHGIIGKGLVYSSWLQASLGTIMYESSRMSKVMLKTALLPETSISPEARSLIKAYGEEHKNEWLRFFHSDKDKISPEDFASVEQFVLEQIEARHIPLIPPKFIMHVILHFRQKVARPIHRVLGRLLPLLAFVQIFIGSSLLKVNVVVQNVLIAWTCLIGFLVFYKETERQFDLPNKVKKALKTCFKAIAHVLCRCCKRKNPEPAVEIPDAQESSNLHEQFESPSPQIGNSSNNTNGSKLTTRQSVIIDDSVSFEQIHSEQDTQWPSKDALMSI